MKTSHKIDQFEGTVRLALGVALLLIAWDYGWTVVGTGAVVLAIVWSAVWYYAAQIVERNIAAWIDQEARNGRVYTFGATGIVNALDAATGRVVWSRNATSDTGRKIPDWGFSSSPLVVDEVVIVAVSGSLVGYDITSGQPPRT